MQCVREGPYPFSHLHQNYSCLLGYTISLEIKLNMVVNMCRVSIMYIHMYDYTKHHVELHVRCAWKNISGRIWGFWCRKLDSHELYLIIRRP